MTEHSEKRASARPPYSGKYAHLPYGAYIRADGSEVLFERNHHPMLERAQREQRSTSSGLDQP